MNNFDIIKAWDDFMKGIEPDPETIKLDILESWQRCRALGMPVDTFNPDNLVPPDECMKYLVPDDSRRFEPFNRVCRDLDITVSFYDKDAKLKYIFNQGCGYEESWKNSRGFFRDASEAEIGTNSVALALLKGAPSLVLGSEHYNLCFRECSCSAAPVFDASGGIIGAVNYSREDLNQNRDTINLLYSLARIYENAAEGGQTSTARSEARSREFGSRGEYVFEDIICRDEGMVKLIAIARKIALTDTSVIIYGESGVGKEMFASSIHNFSNRHGGRFVAVNCGAIPANLIESELFGYEKGAFTGADTAGKMGLLEYSSGGTLFLDEVESMPNDVQVRLLRVISASAVKRIGGLSPKAVDLRIIAASKKDLFDEVIKGRFREDLYYRLNVIDLRIPPLRERPGDIPLIAEAYAELFTEKYRQKPAVPDRRFLDKLCTCSWPGNVRELKNIIERAVIFSEDGCFDSDVIPATAVCASSDNAIENILKDGRGDILPRIESLVIKRILDEDGSPTSAARRLGISRQTLYRKMESLDLS